MTDDNFYILLLNNWFLISGEVSISIEFDPFKIMAEHLVLKFFLFFLLHFPQQPSMVGIPVELPQPKIINFDFILTQIKKFFKVIGSISHNGFPWNILNLR